MHNRQRVPWPVGGGMGPDPAPTAQVATLSLAGHDAPEAG